MEEEKKELERIEFIIGEHLREINRLRARKTYLQRQIDDNVFIMCNECGYKVNRYNFKRHCMTKKHIQRCNSVHIPTDTQDENSLP